MDAGDVALGMRHYQLKLEAKFTNACTSQTQGPINPLPTIGNSLKKQKSLYKVLTPSINPPI